MGLDRGGFSPRVQQKIVHAGVNSPSYQQASRDLAELSDLKVGPKPVERLIRKIGRERIGRRDAAVAAHQRLPLMAKDVVDDPKRSTPSVAMASIDGGRMQIRSDPAEPNQESHWRESKVAVLETYTPVGPLDRIVRVRGSQPLGIHQRRRPSPIYRRVGSHVKTFEACSVFTRVTA